MTPQDLELWKVWEQGADVSVGSAGADRIVDAWAGFPVGTPRADVWRWFDRHFSIGLSAMIEAMVPNVTSHYSFAAQQFIQTAQEPSQQFGMFANSDDDDWGDDAKKRREQPRLL